MICNRRSVLLLDRNFFPIKVIAWKRAMQLIYGRGCAEVISFYEAGETEYDTAVIRLTRRAFPGNPYKIKVKFYRRQVLIRDRFTCMYCGWQNRSDMTIDHVMPKSRGGPTSYDNCVAACKTCNQKKSDNTPEEARMRLIEKPTAPLKGVVLNIVDIPQEWLDFIGR
jgi:5-methylcytosine-specific restriction endonuclease McrA